MQQRRGHSDREVRSRRLALGVAAASLLLLVAPLTGQGVPVLVIDEPSDEETERALARLASDLSWEEKARILLAHDISVPSRPPSQFTLSPRHPYRVPGGYIWVNMSGGTYDRFMWHPWSPRPTGVIEFDEESYPQVSLRQLKPDTHYVLDISMDGVGQLEVHNCAARHGIPFGTFSLSRAQHVFVVMATNSLGGGCFSLVPASGRRLKFLKVEVAELGPAP